MSPRPASFSDAVDSAMEAAVVPSFSRIGYEVRRRLDRWAPVSELDGAGRTVVVTGANSGLGYATAKGLLDAGAAVRLVVRSAEKGRDTRRRLEDETGRSDIDWYVADLTDFDRVRELATEIAADNPRLHAIVHNAGAMFDERTENASGVEMTVALHVVGPQILTAGLVDALDAAGGRVVWMSSGGMYTEPLSVSRLESPGRYRPSTAYARAKRAQVALAREWQQRVGRMRDITFHSMHPGWASTPGVASSLPLFNLVTGPLLRNPDQGADTGVWLCLADEPPRSPGRFWLDREPRSEHRLSRTEREQSVADDLWGHVNRLSGVDATALALPG